MKENENKENGNFGFWVIIIIASIFLIGGITGSFMTDNLGEGW